MGSDGYIKIIGLRCYTLHVLSIYLIESAFISIYFLHSDNLHEIYKSQKASQNIKPLWDSNKIQVTIRTKVNVIP